MSWNVSCIQTSSLISLVYCCPNFACVFSVLVYQHRSSSLLSGRAGVEQCIAWSLCNRYEVCVSASVSVSSLFNQVVYVLLGCGCSTCTAHAVARLTKKAMKVGVRKTLRGPTTTIWIHVYIYTYLGNALFDRVTRAHVAIYAYLGLARRKVLTFSILLDTHTLSLCRLYSTMSGR